MKKILAAWIEQILEFPSKLEYLAYMGDLEQKKQKFRVVSYEQDVSGKVTLQIRKQYNNNNFPEEEKGENVK